MLELLNLKCPRCSAKHRVDRAIRSFECACGANVVVPATLGKNSKSKTAGRSKVSPTEKRAVASAQSSSPKAARDAGQKSAVFKPSNNGSNSATPKPKPVGQAPSGPAKPKASNPLKELPPFQIQPDSEFGDVDAWDSSEYDEVSEVVYFARSMMFLGRTFLPYVIVASLIGAGYYYRTELQSNINRLHGKLVSELRPEVVEPEPPLDGAEPANDPSLEEANAPASDTANLNRDAAALAMQASVQVAVQGMDAGSGVVCDISGKDALVLTNLSLIDPTFRLTGVESSPSKLPRVQLIYSDATRATGEVVWVASGGVDLAIVRASGLSTGIQPMKPVASAAIAAGDPVFYVSSPGSITERMARTVVLDVTADTNVQATPVVQVEATELAVGTALYNRDGELVAISGQSDVLSGGTAMAVHVSALGDVDTPSLLSTPNQ